MHIGIPRGWKINQSPADDEGVQGRELHTPSVAVDTVDLASIDRLSVDFDRFSVDPVTTDRRLVDCWRGTVTHRLPCGDCGPGWGRVNDSSPRVSPSWIWIAGWRPPAVAAAAGRVFVAIVKERLAHSRRLYEISQILTLDSFRENLAGNSARTHPCFDRTALA